MISALVSDFSRVLVMPADESVPSLNTLYTDVVVGKGESFSSHFTINTGLFAYYRKLSERFPVYIFTSGAALHTDSAVAPMLAEFVTEIFTSESLQADKEQPVSYTRLAEKLNLQPETILFVDDKQENTQAAAQAGWQTYQYGNTAGLQHVIEQQI